MFALTLLVFIATKQSNTQKHSEACGKTGKIPRTSGTLIQMSELSAAQLEAARAAFYDRGEDVASWARARGFRPANVYRVLSGQSKAKRGEGHKIAIALGLKVGSVPRLGDAPPMEAGSSQVKGKVPDRTS